MSEHTHVRTHAHTHIQRTTVIRCLRFVYLYAAWLTSAYLNGRHKENLILEKKRATDGFEALKLNTTVISYVGKFSRLEQV